MKIALVCANGGHVTETHELERAYRNNATFGLHTIDNLLLSMIGVIEKAIYKNGGSTMNKVVNCIVLIIIFGDMKKWHK